MNTSYMKISDHTQEILYILSPLFEFVYVVRRVSLSLRFEMLNSRLNTIIPFETTVTSEKKTVKTPHILNPLRQLVSLFAKCHDQNSIFYTHYTFTVSVTYQNDWAKHYITQITIYLERAPAIGVTLKLYH